jgi:hypothetical protein
MGFFIDGRTVGRKTFLDRTQSSGALKSFVKIQWLIHPVSLGHASLRYGIPVYMEAGSGEMFHCQKDATKRDVTHTSTNRKQCLITLIPRCGQRKLPSGNLT